MADALVRGEIAIGPLLYNVIYQKQETARADQDFLPAERLAGQSYASGFRRPPPIPIGKTFSDTGACPKEGQTFMIKELGNLTSLKVPPA